MVNYLLVSILTISLLVTVFICFFTLSHCQSEKRTYFILLTMVVFLYILGYLLEITAGSGEAAFMSVKVIYMGAAFISPAFLLLTTDYCEVNINKAYILVPLLVFPLVITILVWTTESHGLIYTSYEYSDTTPVHYLIKTNGKLYLLNHVYGFLCLFISGTILFNRLKSWSKKYHKQLILLLVGNCIPLIANILYMLKLNKYNINYTPVSLLIFNIFFYINITKYDLFDILPKASKMALQSIKEAFILISSDMGFYAANPAAYETFLSLETLSKGDNITESDFWPQELSNLTEEMNRADVQFCIDNKYYIASINAVYSQKNEIAGWVILIQDITGTVALLEQLKESAYTDGLTGILTRSRFLELASVRIGKSGDSYKQFFIIIFDIDHFKKVNDTYGHQAGDEILRMVATKVKGTLRANDLFGRYGGEEFIIFMEANTRDSLKLPEHLRQTIEKSRVNYGDIVMKVTASFGVASLIHVDSIETCIKNADQALYAAKNGGRNKVEFYY